VKELEKIFKPRGIKGGTPYTVWPQFLLVIVIMINKWKLVNTCDWDAIYECNIDCIKVVYWVKIKFPKLVILFFLQWERIIDQPKVQSGYIFQTLKNRAKRRKALFNPTYLTPHKKKKKKNAPRF